MLSMCYIFISFIGATKRVISILVVSILEPFMCEVRENHLSDLLTCLLKPFSDNARVPKNFK